MPTLSALVRWRARRHPDLEALRQDGRSLTWAELDRSTVMLARGLQDLGVSAGDRVAILDKNSLAYLELLLAVDRIGAVAAPVNWRLVPREVAQVTADAGAALIVAGEEFLGTAESTGVRSLDIAALPRLEGPDPAADRHDAVVWQLSTSGTTGVPKGAMLSNDNVFSCLPGIALEAPEMREGSRSLVAMPLYHIGGCGWAAASLWAGATCVVVREVLPDSLLQTIVEERVNAAFLVPAVLLFLSQVPGAATADFRHLERIFYGASPITPELLTRCIELFGCRFTQVYGLTETTGAITSLRHQDHSGRRLLSCGRANLGVDLRVVDPDGVDVAPDQTGELLVRSRQVMTGYFGRESETATAVHEGWFHTGDAAAIDADGFVYIRDRVKDMIVSGGENVYPVEVENVVAEHPDVIDVAVIGVPDVRWGETVKAVVVRRPGASVEAEAIIEFCRERLAGFKRPTSVDFVEAIPRNPTGKVLKRELRAPYWAGQERGVRGSG